MTGLYTRAVFVFRYDDDALLQKILTTLADVNSAALPNIQGTIRSYVLTEKEFEDAQDGRLDILCGFTVIDNDCRIVLVEGLADGGMQRLHRSVERSQANEIGSCLILANPDIRFSRRLYTQCGPDLKRIRLRQPLAALCERPDVYSSHRVDPACSSALTQLQQMKNADCLKQLQQYRLFPDVRALHAALWIVLGERATLTRQGLVSCVVNTHSSQQYSRLNHSMAKQFPSGTWTVSPERCSSRHRMLAPALPSNLPLCTARA